MLLPIKKAYLEKGKTKHKHLKKKKNPSFSFYQLSVNLFFLVGENPVYFGKPGNAQ